MSKIRLTNHDLKYVIDTFREKFPNGDSFWIFGSRVYPEKRGGDIDLYVETNIENDVVEKSKVLVKFWTKLKKEIAKHIK